MHATYFIIADPNHAESLSGGAELTVAILPRTGAVTLTTMDARLPLDHFEAMLALAMAGCRQVHELLSNAALEYGAALVRQRRSLAAARAGEREHRIDDTAVDGAGAELGSSRGSEGDYATEGEALPTMASSMVQEEIGVAHGAGARSGAPSRAGRVQHAWLQNGGGEDDDEDEAALLSAGVGDR